MKLPKIFHATKVRSLAQLGTREVYLVDYDTTGDVNVAGKFVVKHEKKKAHVAPITQRKTLDFSYKMMQKVAVGAKGRSLDGLETKGFLSLANNASIDATVRTSLNLLVNNPDEVSLVMMEFLDGLSDIETLLGGGNQAAVIRTLGHLMGAVNLERLGRILAVDLFLGNTDRFNCSPTNHYVANAGNIMMRGPMLIGFDPFDPTSKSAKLDQDLLAVKAALADEEAAWTGEMLKTPEQRETVARNALTDLVDYLLQPFPDDGPTLRSFWAPSKQQIKQVLVGLNAGLQEIKQVALLRLNNIRGRKAAPAALRSRMKELKWVK